MSNQEEKEAYAATKLEMARQKALLNQLERKLRNEDADNVQSQETAGRRNDNSKG